MREIKFRAKEKENGKWVYGWYEGIIYPIGESEGLIHCFSDWGLNTTYQVDSKTVGQFTGLKDKNGKEIYEGDVLHIVESGDYGGEYYAPVTYLNNWAVFGIVLLDCKEISPSKTNKRVNTMWTRGFLTRSLGSCVQLHEAMNFEVCEVIGNICENPELLKELEPIK